ncbi:hypothetical protein EVAR_45558_1 [Eumeta japonica]|uniref:Uncharacterized protein n=1 Tax=Eumeta variegata TaxID=151549 RepID=A0A4C1X6G5_EUMVA|nr:hypothetical protein EVAR_45558_1 [Eumeta japonica]
MNRGRRLEDERAEWVNRGRGAAGPAPGARAEGRGRGLFGLALIDRGAARDPRSIPPAPRPPRPSASAGALLLRVTASTNACVSCYFQDQTACN